MYAVLTRVHGAWCARNVDQTRPNLDDLFPRHPPGCIFAKLHRENVRYIRLKDVAIYFT